MKTLNDIERFVGKRIVSELETDLREFRILKEADLQSSFYFHLRRFLKDDVRWRIYSEKSTPHGNYVDLVVSQRSKGRHFNRYKPRLAIELKWQRIRISSKDRKSLRMAVQKLRAKRVYFVTVIHNGSPYQPTDKDEKEKYKLKEVIIRLDDSIDHRTWFNERERIKRMKDLSAHP